jgi:hypothetical protein
MISMTLTDSQRQALLAAAALLRGQAQGLEATGSANTVAAFQGYVRTLDTLAASAGEVEISGEQKTHIEKARHVLEGIRDGLLNADFEKRAAAIQETIMSLEEIVTTLNTLASRR